MYLFLELYGTKKEQQKWHYNLRNPLMNLSDTGIVSRFVLTYHSKPKHPGNARLYLSIDIPELTESTLEAFKSIPDLREISDYITQLESEIKIEVSDYEARVQDSAEVERASKGSAAALKILKEGPKGVDSCEKLVKKVVDCCGQLDAKWRDAAHFCFNSLGFNRVEERALRSSWIVQKVSSDNRQIIDDSMKELFKRESWESSERVPTN